MQSLFSILLIGLTSMVTAQTGSIEGVITDSETGEPFEFCYIALYHDDGSLIYGDDVWQGKYAIHNLPPGHYTLAAFYIDAIEFRTSSVVAADSTTRLDFSLTDCSDYQRPPKVCPEGHSNRITEIAYGLVIDSKKSSRKVILMKY